MTADLLSPARTMCIVGNATVAKDYSSLIDHSDLVVRFNDLNNYAQGTGTKIDLWVMTSNKILLDRLIQTRQEPSPKRPTEPLNKLIPQTSSLWFSIPPHFPTRCRNQTEMFEQIKEEDRKQRITSVAEFLRATSAETHPHRIVEFPDRYVKDLAPDLWQPNWTCPSNGYLITRLLVDDPTYYRYTKIVIGFTWQGWQGHPWVLEELLMKKMQRDELIKIQP